MKGWIRRSFGNRIFATVLIVTLLPLLVCNVELVQLLRIRSEIGLRQEAAQQLAQMEESLSDLHSTLCSVVKALADSTSVKSTLRQNDGSSRVMYQLLRQAGIPLQDYARLHLFNSEGTCLYTTGSTAGSHLSTAGSGLAAQQWPTDWGILYAASLTDSLTLRSTEQGFPLVAAQSVRSHEGSVLGYIVITLESDGLSRLFSGLYSPTTNVLLLDSLWQTIYHTQPALTSELVPRLRSQFLSGEALSGAEGEYHFYIRQHSGSGFYLILQQPVRFSTSVMSTIYALSLLTGILCLILCLICSWHLSRHLSQPVNELDQAMQLVQEGQLDVCLRNDREDELGRLSESFNRMTQEYRLNLERSVQRQKELNETQLRMMQAQLNPHFLYNTLDSMKWMAVASHVPKVAMLATDLAAILRTSISGSELYTLEQELNLLERYIDIQSLRFEDSFTCEIDISEQFQHCIVPKLVLQPLVENAIIHGVCDREDGYIKLFAEKKDDDLLIYVSDNGCGLPPEILNCLNSPDARITGGHLGLNNVNRILRLYFGDGYGLSATSEPGQGSVLCVRLPYRKEEVPHA